MTREDLEKVIALCEAQKVEVDADDTKPDPADVERNRGIDDCISAIQGRFY